LITFHTQRWTDKPLPWVREVVWQNVKNIAKYGMMRMRRRDGATGARGRRGEGARERGREGAMKSNFYVCQNVIYG
jgi:hypothetical protein